MRGPGASPAPEPPGNPRGLDRAWAFLGGLGVLVFYTNLSLFGFEAKWLPAPVIHYALFAGLLLLLATFRPRALVAVAGSGFAIWAVAFLILTLGWSLLTPQSEAHGALLRQRLYCLGLLTAFTLLWGEPAAREAGRRVLRSAVLLGVAFNLVDAIWPLTFTPFLGRSTGLYLNPNVSGIALLMGGLAAWEAVPERWRAAYYGAVLLGIFTTFSRSAAALGILLGAALCLMGRFRWRAWGGALVGVAALAAVGATILLTSKWAAIGGDVMADLGGRLVLSTDDFSTQERAYVAREALSLIASAPLVGHGTGASLLWGYEVSSHNIYLNLLVDHGLWGLFVIPGLLWSQRGEAGRMTLLAMAGWALIGFVSHNVLDEASWIVLIPLLPYVGEPCGRPRTSA